MTSPLEAMARAYDTEFALWAYGHVDGHPRIHKVWRDEKVIALSGSEKAMEVLMREMRREACMRAALLALAEAVLPTDWFFRDMFHAYCRALANEPRATKPSASSEEALADTASPAPESLPDTNLNCVGSLLEETK